MYAVIVTGGKQLRVQVGDVVRVENLAGDVGAKIVFEKVLMLGGKKSKLGTPTVEGAQVKGTVVEQGRAAKILVRTYKRRQNSNRTSQGHRQGYTAVKIDAIKS